MTLVKKKYKVVDLFEITKDIDKYLIEVILNGKSHKFKIDSGAKYSLLVEDDFQHLNLCSFT